MALSDSMMRANLDNVLGLNIFLGQAYEMEPAQFDAFLEQNPALVPIIRDLAACYPVSEANKAFEDALAGKNVKTVLVK